MKTWKILLAALLTVAMICVLAACVSPESSADKTATVTFYNGDKVYETVTVEIGAKLTLPKAPKAEKGKGLVGWSTIDGDVEEVIDPAKFVVKADVSLYALWADVFTVVINADNGTPFVVKEVFAGTVIEQPADPVKEGFKFVEWRDAINDATYDFSRPIYSDLTLKAMYGDGAPNRVSDTKWDFSTGIHGSWIGAQGGWKYEVNGLPAENMVYQTTENGYAAWGFTLTDSLDNIPVINGNNDAGLGMKYIYNEGISVAANKAKLVVVYLKPKYFPIDMATSPNDQFRISVLTSNGGMIYGYGSGSEAWSLRTDAGSKNLIQVDNVEGGWIRVQFKIHELDVWSEDAVIKGMAISFVQRKATPVMDVISFKSIELLDQEEFIDPHKIEYVTEHQWDMTKEEESKDWFGVMSAGVDTNSVKTTINANGTKYIYANTNKWRGMVMNMAKIDISKCSGIFSATIDVSGMNPTNYRLYIVTDRGGDLYKNSGRDDVSCYYAVTNAKDLAEGWTVKPNADGTITVYYDLTKLEYWKTGTELQGLSFVTVDATTNGTVVYKSVSLVDSVNVHNCATDGHILKGATCIKPATCTVCGATQGEAKGHSFAQGVCSVCGVSEDVKSKWNMSDEKDAADWTAYHAKKKNEALTTAVTAAGLKITYGGAGNGWKGVILENASIDIGKLTGKLTFTYSSELAITSYRIHILTDLGGDLTDNGSADCYIAVSIADIKAGSLKAWTQTVNQDGSVTVTFDLSTFSYFAEGSQLKGLTIVTVTANNTTGSVTYKSIELEETIDKHNCQVSGHIMDDATCTEPKTCSVCGETEGEPAGHDWDDATCTEPKTCSVCGETEGEPAGHDWNDATCLAPKTCAVCGETEGDLGNHVDADEDYKCDNCEDNLCTEHDWDDATCTKPKTCSVCGTTEGEPTGHTWNDATCLAPKTCSVCGETEGEKISHADADKDHVCDMCACDLVAWYLNKVADAQNWAAYHAMKKNEALSFAVKDAGLEVTFAGAGNGWKGIVLENAAINIGELTGKLTFTYSSNMTVASYRVYVLTDKGGHLVSNNEATSGYKPANYYATATISAVAGSAAWTRTENADGSVTVTFDLNTLPFFAEGAELRGLTVCTVTANSTTGVVTYKSVELEKTSAEHDCQADGHIMMKATCTKPKICAACGITEGEPAGHDWDDATCLAPKTCSVCGETEGALADHDWDDATCTAPKTCSVCGETEGEPAGHDWDDATCTAPKTCSVCGETEGELADHVDEDEDLKCDECEGNLCVEHDWDDATCLAPKTCSICGETEGALADHDWDDATCTAPKTCSVCGETEGEKLAHTDADKDHACDVCTGNMVVWYMNTDADASQWYCAQAYTEVREHLTYSQVTIDGFTANYGHKNAWKGIILKNAEIDITNLSGQLSFTYKTENLDITDYRIHVLTDQGGYLESNSLGTPSNYYVAVAITNIAQSEAWTRTVNADGSVTVTFDLTTLPFFAEGTVLMGMDIVTVANSTNGEWRSITYSSIAIS